MSVRTNSEDIITFAVTQREYYYFLEFTLPTENIEPEELRHIRVPQLSDGSKGVILSGKGPIWLYGMLIHEYHPTAWVATNDLRKGPVVVESHIRNMKKGNVIDLNMTDEQFKTQWFAQGRH